MTNVLWLNNVKKHQERQYATWRRYSGCKEVLSAMVHY